MKFKSVWKERKYELIVECSVGTKLYARSKFIIFNWLKIVQYRVNLFPKGCRVRGQGI